MTWAYLKANKTRADALFAPGTMVGMLQRITGGWADETIANEALAMAGDRRRGPATAEGLAVGGGLPRQGAARTAGCDQ